MHVFRWIAAGALASFLWTVEGATTTAELVITNDTILPPGTNRLRLVVRASHVTIRGDGATLLGPGEAGDLESFETAGAGILIEGATDVVLTGVNVHGFANGLLMRDSKAISVTKCDFSDNYHNPKHGWGELPPRGGILCERVQHSVFRENRAERVWDGMRLIDSDDNLVTSNDFSHCSNTAISLWHSSRNRFLENDLSYGIRIDRAAGEVHARDSTGVLIETGSNDNYWYRNNVTYGGDGIFIRPLNRWVSRGNIFVENDTSYANNNCVESWSPGNTFIRNKANHGSYGFWLGGSDQTVLIGNEAAYNGLPDGNHNAPEPGFGHGGIVIVGGSSSHTVLDGNHVHHNNGAGIAFRGDVGSKGARWRTEHWVVQRNVIANNRFGLWGRWADSITFAANLLTNNAAGNNLTNVSRLRDLGTFANRQTAPLVELLGPEIGRVGDGLVFDASNSRNIGEGALQFRWAVGDDAFTGTRLEHVFSRPGFYRVNLTVDNGALAAIAWRDLLIVPRVEKELGTEGEAGSWSFRLEGNDGAGRVIIQDEAPGLIGRYALRFTPKPYPGAEAAISFPADRNANWDLRERKAVQFWIKTENPNLPGFQNAGPIIRLHGPHGSIEFKPAKDANLLNDPPYSEARWLWMPITIPLEGNSAWQRRIEGEVHLERIDAITIAVDSWGGDPFTVWIDGLTIE